MNEKFIMKNFNELDEIDPMLIVLNNSNKHL
jgi:hypothetical protein